MFAHGQDGSARRAGAAGVLPEKGYLLSTTIVFTFAVTPSLISTTTM